MKSRVLILLVVASVLFASLVFLTRSQEQAFREALTATEPVPAIVDIDPPPPPPGLHIADIVSSCKLITAEAQGRATARQIDQNWRGAAIATVSAPATILFGVDLANLPADHMSINDELRVVHFRVPLPQRLATTIDGARMEEDVRVRGLRTRGGIGRKLVERAKQQLYVGVDDLPTAPGEYERVLNETTQQIEAFVHRFTGGDYCVEVEFERDGFESPQLALGFEQ